MQVKKLFEVEEASEKQRRIQNANPNLSDEDAHKFVKSIKTSGNKLSKGNLTDEEKDEKIKKMMKLNPKLSLADAKAFYNKK
jgi:hypothetical protein